MFALESRIKELEVENKFLKELLTGIKRYLESSELLDPGIDLKTSLNKYQSS